jgi:hypothetical protein
MTTEHLNFQFLFFIFQRAMLFASCELLKSSQTNPAPFW